MNLKAFNRKRKITSYFKVQMFVTKYIAFIWRSKSIFVNKKKLSQFKYLNVGSGNEPFPDFINVDYRWLPGVQLTWDIGKIKKKKYPIASNSLEGIYTEHCLEHVTYYECLENLKEFHRMMKTGSYVRIIVPDGELYIDLYIKRRAGEKIKLPREEELNEATPMISINRVSRGWGAHKYLYDFETMKHLLEMTGFKEINKVSFMQGKCEKLLKDRVIRQEESLYIEATKL